MIQMAQMKHPSHRPSRSLGASPRQPIAACLQAVRCLRVCAGKPPLLSLFPSSPSPSPEPRNTTPARVNSSTTPIKGYSTQLLDAPIQEVISAFLDSITCRVLPSASTINSPQATPPTRLEESSALSPPPSVPSRPKADSKTLNHGCSRMAFLDSTFSLPHPDARRHLIPFPTAPCSAGDQDPSPPPRCVLRQAISLRFPKTVDLSSNEHP